MRWQIRWGVALLGIIVVCPCGCRTSREELGEIIYDVSKVPGAEKPYELPDLGDEDTDAENADAPVLKDEYSLELPPLGG